MAVWAYLTGMASDEELARRVAQQEEAQQSGSGGGPSVTDELDQYKATAGEIHDELARRIENVDEEAIDEEALEPVVERLDRLESRLDDLESRIGD